MRGILLSRRRKKRGKEGEEDRARTRARARARKSGKGKSFLLFIFRARARARVRARSSSFLRLVIMNLVYYNTPMDKQTELKQIFALCPTSEAKYQKIIELGKNLPPFDPAQMVTENIVQGCQSIMYLHSHLEDGKLFFNASSEALISKGLAALLIFVYSGEAPETILKAPADYLQELGIYASLSPGRSNGLSSMYLRMKQEAVKLFLSKKLILS